MIKKRGIYFLGVLLILRVANASAQVGQGASIKGTYAIKNVQTGMLLRVKDAQNQNGTPLVLYTPTNWKCMTWDFRHQTGNTYQLENLFTHKTVQPVSVPASPAGKIAQQPIQANDANQQWEFISVATQTYLIKLKNTDLYLTPSDQQGSVNSDVVLSPKQTTKSQYWTIYEQHPTF